MMNYDDIIFHVMTFLILSPRSGIVTHLYWCKIFFSDHEFEIFAEILLYHICQIISVAHTLLKVTERIIFFVYEDLFTGSCSCQVRFVPFFTKLVQHSMESDFK